MIIHGVDPAIVRNRKKALQNTMELLSEAKRELFLLEFMNQAACHSAPDNVHSSAVYSYSNGVNTESDSLGNSEKSSKNGANLSVKTEKTISTIEKDKWDQYTSLDTYPGATPRKKFIRDHVSMPFSEGRKNSRSFLNINLRTAKCYISKATSGGDGDDLVWSHCSPDRACTVNHRLPVGFSTPNVRSVEGLDTDSESLGNSNQLNSEQTPSLLFGGENGQLSPETADEQSCHLFRRRRQVSRKKYHALMSPNFSSSKLLLLSQKNRLVWERRKGRLLDFNAIVNSLRMSGVFCENCLKRLWYVMRSMSNISYQWCASQNNPFQAAFTSRQRTILKCFSAVEYFFKRCYRKVHQCIYGRRSLSTRWLRQEHGIDGADVSHLFCGSNDRIFDDDGVGRIQNIDDLGFLASLREYTIESYHSIEYGVQLVSNCLVEYSNRYVVVKAVVYFVYDISRAAWFALLLVYDLLRWIVNYFVQLFFSLFIIGHSLPTMKNMKSFRSSSSKNRFFSPDQKSETGSDTAGETYSDYINSGSRGFTVRRISKSSYSSFENMTEGLAAVDDKVLHKAESDSDDERLESLLDVEETTELVIDGTMRKFSNLLENVKRLEAESKELFLEIVYLNELQLQEAQSHTTFGQTMKITGQLFTLLGIVRFISGMWNVMRYFSGHMGDSHHTDLVTMLLSFLLVYFKVELSYPIWLPFLSSTLVGTLALLHIRGFLITAQNLARFGFVITSTEHFALTLAFVTASYFIACVLLLRGQLPPRFRVGVSVALGEHLPFDFYFWLFDFFFTVSSICSALFLWTDYTKKHGLGSINHGEHAEKVRAD